MSTSILAMLMFFISTGIYIYTGEDKYQLYSLIMLATQMITSAIEMRV